MRRRSHKLRNFFIFALIVCVGILIYKFDYTIEQKEVSVTMSYDKIVAKMNK
ncbi:MAG: hypothetical protein MJ247_05455 [Alphaproteobacteria bacterium]|nr:hypothetical protein [Alphaproteobacteria bacterium]